MGLTFKENCPDIRNTKVLDIINGFKEYNLKVDVLFRKMDEYSWQYCNKGFFNFKNYIPKILKKFT